MVKRPKKPFDSSYLQDMEDADEGRTMAKDWPWLGEWRPVKPQRDIEAEFDESSKRGDY